MKAQKVVAHNVESILENLDRVKKELEIAKLNAEIHNLEKPFYKQFNFYTSLFPLFITLTAAALTINSGIFDTKNQMIELKNMHLQDESKELYARKKGLGKSVDSLNVKISNLQTNYVKSNRNFLRLKDSASQVVNQLLISSENLKSQIKVDRRKTMLYTKIYALYLEYQVTLQRDWSAMIEHDNLVAKIPNSYEVISATSTERDSIRRMLEADLDKQFNMDEKGDLQEYYSICKQFDELKPQLIFVKGYHPIKWKVTKEIKNVFEAFELEEDFEAFLSFLR
jgi:hypothetical protein